MFRFKFAILIVLLGTLTVSAQENNLQTNDCPNTLSRSISEIGENGVKSAIRAKENEFNIIVDPGLKPVKFISSVERYYRSQVQNVDTTTFFLIIPDWKKLSSSQKLVIMEQQMIRNEALAREAHEANNTNRQLIYMVNNTGTDVALQMQDSHFIGVLEARVSQDNWRSVQYLTFSWCGNSYILKHIATGDTACFVTSLTTGNYKTTLRYKILGKDQFYYSNEFKGNINYCDLYDTRHSSKEKLEAYVKYSLDH